jgi:BolA protein
VIDRVQRIEHRLRERLQAPRVEVADDSALHAGHEGAASGGHYTVTVVSPKFRGLNPIQRHRLIYETLGELMQTDIHALSIRAFAPDEA